MTQHNLPNVSKISDRLADNNARVVQAVEQLQVRMDALLAALRNADLEEVQRLSQDLVREAEAPGDTVRYRAERVCEELRKPNNLRAIKQSVVRLIGAFGHGKPAPDDAEADWQI